ncbi:MAG: hypothetical protein QOG74_2767 [Alphaproteobacteria bacterium]|jgi:hypothetical protein|nr:hypothetical protein [Alphaproteobacteria bacterium]
MSDIFTRRLLARQLGAAGLGMIAALAASDLARATTPNLSTKFEQTNNMKKPPDKAQAGSQKQNIKAFQRQQYVKAQCAQLKAQLQNPGLSGSQQAAILSQMNVLHCK